MAQLTAPFLSLQHPEILRVVRPSQVLRRFGAVLKGDKDASFFFSGKQVATPFHPSQNSASSGAGVASTTARSFSTQSVGSDSSGHMGMIMQSTYSYLRGQRVCDMPSDERERAEALWQQGSVATGIDVFISHVWGVPRWQKALGLYYYLNVNCAMAAALAIWFCVLVSLLLCNGLTGMGGMSCLVPLLVYVPISAFFLTFFSAHVFRPRLRLWLDKLCIHQANQDLKELGMQHMMDFVRCSGRMCILWDPSYFERLWCNAEVATFCATHGGPKNVDFVPLWQPPFVFVALILEVVCCSLMSHVAWISITIAGFFAELIGPTVWSLLLAAPCIGVIQWGACYLPMLIPNYIALTKKIRQHETMMRQVGAFRYAETKCTVESDRDFVDEHIVDLFGEAGDSEVQALARFDEFMHVDFQAMMRERLGAATVLPTRETVLLTLPLLFSSSAIVLGCDGDACTVSASAEMPPAATWLDQVTAYMIVNTLTYGTVIAFYPAMYPLMLRLVSRAMRARSSILRSLLTFLSLVAGYCYVGVVSGLACGMTILATSVSRFFVLGLMIYWLTLASVVALLVAT